MYQEWFKEYEKIINEGKKTEYCPKCGRKFRRKDVIKKLRTTLYKL